MRWSPEVPVGLFHLVGFMCEKQRKQRTVQTESRSLSGTFDCPPGIKEIKRAGLSVLGPKAIESMALKIVRAAQALL